ncbi:MAG: hypothetical protein HY903_20910 [Deltaproteobacteria bacterium]|nr:hypothetical protein [Deltaproteobacteria bacterium]
MPPGAESILDIGGVRLAFCGCRSEDLPASFTAFASDGGGAVAGSYEVEVGALHATRGQCLAENRAWRLHDDGDRLWWSGLGEPREHAMLTAALAPDWSQGVIHVHPEAPAKTRRAPVTSHLGELLLAVHLNRLGGLYVHAAAVAFAGDAYVLLGASGAGKSTLAGLAADAGATVLSDDRTVLREEAGRLFAYGTPFHGTERRFAQAKAPVRALVFLAHGAANALTPFAGLGVAARLLSLCFCPFWSKAAVERTIATVGRLSAMVTARKLAFLPQPAAVQCLLRAR